MVEVRGQMPLSGQLRMPAEWETHDATWLAWPHDADSFPGEGRLGRVEQSYIMWIDALAPHERVDLFVTDPRMKSRVTSLLNDADVPMDSVTFHQYPHRDIWMRDYGPIFVDDKNSQHGAIINSKYNAYGWKYEQLLPDTRLPSVINRSLHLPSYATGLVFEGGSVDVNGRGTVITTEQCLLNPNRRHKKSRKDVPLRDQEGTRRKMESFMDFYLGAAHAIWLPEGIEGDDTDGHVDDIARFSDGETIVYTFEKNKNDTNYNVLKRNEKILQNARDQDGNQFRLVPLPMPRRMMRDDEPSRRLAASYANFYIANEVVIVPTFEQDTDEEALTTLTEVFPGRQVIGIPAKDLVYGGGTFHCASQQQPKFNY